MGARASVGVLAAGFIACSVIFSTPITVYGADADPAGGNAEVLPPDKRQGFQEEQDVIQQAIEQLRREANTPARPALEQPARDAALVPQRESDSIDSRLSLIERTLTMQHQRELEALQNSNRTLLIIAGIFASVGFLGILFAALIMVRAMNRLSEIAMGFPAGYGPGPGRSLIALGAGDLHPAVASQADQVSARFLGAIERLEKRIGEMEHTAQAPATDTEINYAVSQQKAPAPKATPAAAEESPALSISALRNKKSNGQPIAASATNTDKGSQVALLLGKGQALLNLGQAEEAMACFEMAIALDPTNADALVKRGMALEKLQKVEEAINSYDRAIAANNSMTLAYLYKGAACNRLQRFREALECYEKALTTEQKPVAS